MQILIGSTVCLEFNLEYKKNTISEVTRPETVFFIILCKHCIFVQFCRYNLASKRLKLLSEARSKIKSTLTCITQQCYQAKYFIKMQNSTISHTPPS